MTAPLHIVVMHGGPSAERDVSRRSGQAVASALRSLGHTVDELDPAPGAWTLPPSTDAVFLALHGAYGEDGAIQQELEQLGVPYTGSGPDASRIAFDKALAKEKFLAAGVPTARFVLLHDPGAPWPPRWSPPVVVKPARQGSSVGLQFVRRPDDWPQALSHAFEFDSKVLIEEFVAGRETTVGILGDRTLPVVEVRPRQGHYDFQNKYTPGATEYFCPAPLDPDLALRIRQAGLAAHRAVGARDYSRVDVLLTPDGQPVVLEVNTLPGMTETSLLPKAAAAAGISYPALCQTMIQLAIDRPSRPRIPQSQS
ncbi:MAG TPA: D-alanine--D-alanine ligase [Candidatus Paceibacterota bacterium]|nr:D-alanine--D-alanine ligase [Verrucomicrobiota bacterium]HRZ45762.1 D-alanine--D-alanine ligase [Candidatus Paceibacterota bacterium]HRZ93642.1 D-alanine--D-alanine ligase [Candidatus Paceibacterota bacterium]